MKNVGKWKVRTMKFKNFLQKQIQANSLTANKFGSLTAGNRLTDKIDSSSIFSSASLENIQDLDFASILGDETDNINEEGISTEQKALTDVVKALMGLEEVQTAIDIDGDGKVSEQEAMSFLQGIMGKDGDDSNLTYSDIDKVLSEMGVDLEAAADKAVAEALEDADLEELTIEPEEVKEAKQASSSNGVNNGGSVNNAGSSNRSSSSNSVNNSSNKAETPEEIQAKIDEKNGEINQVEDQAEKDIQAEEQAKEEAMKQAGVSEEEYKAYKEKEQELENNIKKTEEAISEQDTKISDAESSISSNESYISSIEGQISANNAAISGISSDDENGAAKKAEISSKNAALEEEKQKIENDNIELKKDIKEAEAKKVDLEKEKQGYETQKQELLSQSLDNSAGFGKGIPSSDAAKLKENLGEYDNKIAEIRTKKNEEVAKIRNEIQDLQVKLKDAQEAKERNKTLAENSAIDGQSILDFASQFEGKTQAEMREIMRAKGAQFDDGAWCADFVNFVAKNTLGEENLPDWYKNCSNRAYCPTILNDAKANNATISVAEAKPGDAILFDWDGDGTPNHIGYVISVNPDGSVNTIEGNTNGDSSNSQVAKKVRYPKDIMTCVKLT